MRQVSTEREFRENPLGEAPPANPAPEKEGIE